MLLFANNCQLSRSFSLNCSYSTGIYSYTGSTYICVGALLSDEDNDTLESIVGIHESGKNNDNVQGIKIESQNMVYFPYNIEASFPNIIVLYFPFNLISTISNDDLTPFPNLVVLYLYSNNITSLDSDLFSGLSSLQYINLEYNQIKNVGHDLFLPDTGDIYFKSNSCIDMNAKTAEEIISLKLNLLVKCPPTISQIEASLESRSNLLTNINDNVRRLINRNHQLERRVGFLEAKPERLRCSKFA